MLSSRRAVSLWATRGWSTTWVRTTSTLAGPGQAQLWPVQASVYVVFFGSGALVDLLFGELRFHSRTQSYFLLGLFIRVPLTSSILIRALFLRPVSASGRVSVRITCESTNHEIRLGVTSTA